MTPRAALLALPLAACGQAPDQAADVPTIPCAKAGAALAPVCTVDRVRGERGLILTLRHPGGAFRRLLVTTDGRGVVAADGAEPARVVMTGPNGIEVAIADERYRLPATQVPAP